MLPASVFAMCSAAEERCAPLKDYPSDHQQCVALVCGEAVPAPVFQEPVQEVAPTRVSGTDTCDNGLRRCASLRDNLVAYWACMEDTCFPEEIGYEQKKADCEHGQQTCAYLFKEYRMCVNVICNNKRYIFNECTKSKEPCGPTLAGYWDCVSRECLGDVQEYIENAKRTLDADTRKTDDSVFKRNMGGVPVKTDAHGNIIPPVLGVPERLSYAPDGIDQNAYSRKNSPERMLQGAPSNYLKCDRVTKKGEPVRLLCNGNDMMSCMCSNGKLPSRVDNSFEAQKKRFEEQRKRDARTLKQKKKREAEKIQQVLSGRINLSDPQILKRALREVRSGKAVTNPTETDAEKKQRLQEFIEKEKRRMGVK